MRPLRLFAALAATVLCGCPPPAPQAPDEPSPVVEVEVAPAPDTTDELNDEADGPEPTPPGPEDVEDAESEELSEEEQHREEVADALASLTATGAGLSSGVGWGSSGLGLGGSSGGLGMGHGPLNGPHVTVPGKGTNIRGALPKEVIRRVVRKNLSAFKHCYEKQLLKDPKLEGKVVVKFVISKSGGVAQATITKGLETELDACVKNVAVRMMFPQPEGGGLVIVNYPFVFSSANAP